jgi:hypothetical protein
MPLSIYVAPELTIEEYLERGYGVERKQRMRIAPVRRPSSSPPPMKRRGESIQTIQISPAIHTPRPAALESSLKETFARLETVTEKEQIADAALQFAHGRFETALLFLVRHDEALWWKGYGPGVDSAALDGTAISLWTPSCLSIAFGSHACWRGKPAWIHDPLWALLRVPPPEDAFVAPISIGNHVANLFYAHAPGRGRLDDGIVDAMAAVAEAAGEGYTRLLHAARAGVT